MPIDGVGTSDVLCDPSSFTDGGASLGFDCRNGPYEKIWRPSNPVAKLIEITSFVCEGSEKSKRGLDLDYESSEIF